VMRLAIISVGLVFSIFISAAATSSVDTSLIAHFPLNGNEQ
jgi:hypothetical protein